jgi:hypothetical protein
MGRILLMEIITKNWSTLKSLISSHYLKLQCVEDDKKYKLFAFEGDIQYICELWKNTSIIQGIDITQNNLDIMDFEVNHKSETNRLSIPISSDGKQIIRAESRPLEYTTWFTCRGDSQLNIGNGSSLFWDFNNDDDLVNYNYGDTFKTKRIEFKFLDTIAIKEGAIYFKNAPVGSFIDLFVVCPANNYYLKNNGTPAFASSDMVISHYVNHHFIFDTCCMGDELNTEACSIEIPTTYKFWIDITVPSYCNNCSGHISLEIFRKRTVIL